MEAKELRIGNIVKTNNKANNCEPDVILQVLGIGLELDFTDGTTQNYIAVEGIPITEEWMLKAGFELEKTEDADWYFKQTMFGNFGWAKISNPEYWFMYQECRPIRYIHELQNLFYSLTSKELTIQ